TVVKGGPWSQGPVLLQQLALLQGFDLDSLDPTGPDFVHIVTECAKLAYADREAWYGDPDFVDVPMATLLSPAYNDARRKLVADLGAEGWRTLDGVRHARRRRAGPVVDAAVPAPCPSRHEFAGGDRLPGIQQRTRTELVLSSRRPSRLAGAGRPLSGNDPARP